MARLKSERLVKETQINRLEMNMSEKADQINELQRQLRQVLVHIWQCLWLQSANIKSGCYFPASYKTTYFGDTDFGLFCLGLDKQPSTPTQLLCVVFVAAALFSKISHRHDCVDMLLCTKSHMNLPLSCNQCISFSSLVHCACIWLSRITRQYFCLCANSVCNITLARSLQLKCRLIKTKY